MVGQMEQFNKYRIAVAVAAFFVIHWIFGLVESLLFGLQTDGKSIVVNRNMETNLPGVYAAGDCTGAPYQIAKAVGEGLVAALSAAAEIDRRKDCFLKFL